MNMIRSFATVGGYTMVSRILGFIRDIMIAATLGTGPVADAFFVAFRFPNLFRRLFAEGAFNAAFVPLFAKRVEGEGLEAACKFASDALNVLLATLIVTTVLAELTMPWLMYVIVPGFTGQADKFDLAILLTRITFPYLLAVSIVALLSGVLNSLGRFAAAAAVPVVLNIIMISALAWLAATNQRGTDLSGETLAWAVSAAGFAQLIMLWWAARRAGMSLQLRAPRLTPGLRRLIRLGIPGVIAGGVTQINLLIGTIIASMQDGAVSYLYYADRIYQLPLGVVGIAIGIVLLPDLSRKLRSDENAAAEHIQNRACELSLLLTIPAAVALIVIPLPIISVLFEHGAFRPEDSMPTAFALMAFATGLPSFVLIKVFSPGFFAREDTRTPMIFAAISVAVNISGSLALFPLLGHVGIAVATSLSGWVNAGLLFVTLVRRGHFSADAGLMSRLPRTIVASMVMGVALWAVAIALAPWLVASEPLPVRIGALAMLIISGLAVLGIALVITGAANPRQILRQLLKRS